MNTEGRSGNRSPAADGAVRKHVAEAVTPLPLPHAARAHAGDTWPRRARRPHAAGEARASHPGRLGRQLRGRRRHRPPRTTPLSDAAPSHGRSRCPEPPTLLPSTGADGRAGASSRRAPASSPWPARKPSTRGRDGAGTPPPSTSAEPLTATPTNPQRRSQNTSKDANHEGNYPAGRPVIPLAAIRRQASVFPLGFESTGGSPSERRWGYGETSTNVAAASQGVTGLQTMRATWTHTRVASACPVRNL